MAGGVLLSLLLGAVGWRAHSGNPAALAVAIGWAAATGAGYAWARVLGRLPLFRRLWFAVLAVLFLVQMHLPRAGPDLEPYCHLALAGNFVHEVWNQWLALAGGTWRAFGPLSLGILWLAVVLAAGGAFCSWACFLGGIDDAMSSVRRPLFRIPNSSRIRVFQLAFLLVIAGISFVHLEPGFCRAVCPFKLTGGITAGHAHPVLARAVSFGLIGGLFLLALPLLTGQRTFCSGICPFGAIPPLLAWLSPWRVGIDREACNGCGNCESSCPSFAVDRQGNGFAVNAYCTSCLRCVDSCPGGAVRPPLSRGRLAALFPWVVVALGGALSVFYVPAAVLALARLGAGGPP